MKDGCGHFKSHFTNAPLVYAATNTGNSFVFYKTNNKQYYQPFLVLHIHNQEPLYILYKHKENVAFFKFPSSILRQAFSTAPECLIQLVILVSGICVICLRNIMLYYNFSLKKNNCLPLLLQHTCTFIGLNDYEYYLDIYVMSFSANCLEKINCVYLLPIPHFITIIIIKVIFPLYISPYYPSLSSRGRVHC